MCIVQYNQALPEMLCMRSLLWPLSPIIHSAFMYVYSTNMFLVPLDPLYKVICQHFYMLRRLCFRFTNLNNIYKILSPPQNTFNYI